MGKGKAERKQGTDEVIRGCRNISSALQLFHYSLAESERLEVLFLWKPEARIVCSTHKQETRRSQTQGLVLDCQVVSCSVSISRKP